MANEQTQVTYDVSQAIAALQQLDDKVKASGKTTEDAFNKGGEASKKFESNVGGLAQSLVSGAGGVAFFANNIVELGGHFAEAAEQGVHLAETIAEQAFGFETAEKQIDDFIKKIDSIATTVQNGIDITNAAENAAAERRLFLNSRSQLAAERAQLQGISQEQSALQIRLSANKAFYSQLESIAEKSARKREQAETQLDQLVASVNQRRFLASIARFSDNAQISKIVEQANNLEKQGGKENLQSAEDLLNKALSKAQDTGNVANINRVEAAFDKLIQKRRDDATAAEKQAASDKANADAAAKETASIAAQSQGLKEKTASIQATVTASALARGEEKKAQEERLRTQAFDKAQLELRSSLVALNKIDNQQVNPGQRIAAAIKSPLNTVLSDPHFKEQLDLMREAESLQQKIDARVKANPTPGGIAATTQDESRLKEVIGELKSLPNLAPSLQVDLNNLESAAKIYERIQKAAEATARASAKLDGTGPDALPPLRPNPVAPPNQLQNQAAPGPKTVSQNINVELSVRGGMIDSDTVQQLTERVTREIRKGTVA